MKAPPNQPNDEQLLRIDAVIQKTGMARSTIYKKNPKQRISTTINHCQTLSCMASKRDKFMDQLSKEFVDPGGRKIMFNCPHCGAKSLSRTSRFVSDLVRDVVFVCTDIECGHTFLAQLAAVRTISPSSKPRQGIFLPMSEVKQKLIRDQVSLNKPDGGAYSMVLSKSAEYKKPQRKSKPYFAIPAQEALITALHGINQKEPQHEAKEAAER